MASDTQSEDEPEIVAMTIRLPREMVQDLRRKATREQRSLAGAFRHAVQLYVTGVTSD